MRRLSATLTVWSSTRSAGCSLQVAQRAGDTTNPVQTPTRQPVVLELAAQQPRARRA